MGIYINPPNCTKEQFLNVNAIQISIKEFLNFDISNKEMSLVVLVDNGPFTAAAVAYNDEERKAFTAFDDFRPKKFYKVFSDLLTIELAGCKL